jgi:hypothetical protein
MSFSEFSLEANRMGFVGLQVLPAIGVSQQSAEFAKIPVEQLLREIQDTKRTPKAPYKEDDFEWGTDSYATEDHGAAEVLDDRSIAMYGDMIRSEFIHRQRAVNRVLMALEDAIATAVFNSTTWTGSALTTAASVAWTTQASGVPIDDIDDAIEAVKSSSGMRPNALIITDYGLRLAKRTAQIEDLLKYSGRDDPKNLGIISGLQELFGLEKIIVADGFKNTADQGLDASFSRLWDTTMAMVARVADGGSMDLEDPNPVIGRTIFWGEDNAAIPGMDDDGSMSLIVEEFREEKRRGGIIRARNDRQVKILFPQAGHLITGIHT